MSQLGGWKTRGVGPVIEDEPTYDELQRRVYELDDECDWWNSWTTELLNIALKHAKDAAALRADIAAAKSKADQNRRKGVATNADIAANTERVARKLFRMALEQHRGDRDAAYSVTRKALADLAEKTPAEIRAWSDATIRKKI